MINLLVKALLVFAMSCGPFVPWPWMLRLKSSAAFPKYMRRMRKDAKPIKHKFQHKSSVPDIEIHTDKERGNANPSGSPLHHWFFPNMSGLAHQMSKRDSCEHDEEKEGKCQRYRKKHRCNNGGCCQNRARCVWGKHRGIYGNKTTFTFATAGDGRITHCKEAWSRPMYKLDLPHYSAWYRSLWLYERLIVHSSTGDLPSIPRNILGPSTASFDPGCVSTEDGITVKRDTWPCSMTTGARYAKSMRNKAVSIKMGVKYKVVAFEMSASMAVERFYGPNLKWWTRVLLYGSAASKPVPQGPSK